MFTSLLSVFKGGSLVPLSAIAGLLSCVPILGGCMVGQTGRGEYGVGYSSTTKVFVYHEPDGDKDGLETSVTLEASVVDAILGAYLKDADEDAPVEGNGN